MMMMMMMPRLGHPGFFSSKNSSHSVQCAAAALSLIGKERWPSQKSLAGTVTNCLHALAVSL